MSEGQRLPPVEGIPQRNDVMVFTKQHWSYFPGERACFLPEEATALAALGVAAPAAAATNTSGPHSAPDMANLLTALQGVTDGGFTIPINGPLRSVRGSFATATTPQAVCNICNAQLGANGTMTVNASAPYRFVITSPTTGPTSTIGYAQAPVGGTPIHDALQLTASGGAVLSQGVRE